MRVQKQKGRERGMAMVATMLVLLGLMSLTLLGMVASGGGKSGGSGVLTTTSNALQSSSARLQETSAFNLAEAGAEYARLWLSQQSVPPNNTRAFAPALWGGTIVGTAPPRAAVNFPDATHTFSVSIYPDSDNPNAATTQKAYLIESIGTCGNDKQILHVYVQQTSFGHYAVFVDQNPAGAYWSNDLHVFDGPVHSNNSDGGSPATPNGPANILLWHSEAAAKPIFTYNYPDAFTVSGPAVTYYKDNYGASGTPTTETDWKKIATYGSGGIATGKPIIEFPTTDKTVQHDRALGGNSAPSATGVTIEPGGGIYIHCKKSSSGTTPAPSPNNDVQQMTLSVDGSGNQVITVQQTGDTGAALSTVVTIDKANNRTRVSVNGGATTNYNGNLTNGVVYCDGNIGKQNACDDLIGNASAAKTGGLNGVVADNQALTVATYIGTNSPTDPSKNCNINGSITYKTPRQKYVAGDTIPSGYSVGDYKPEALDTGNFKTKAGTLGIVSNNVEVTRYSGTGTTSEITNIEVDAAVFAYGTYDACAYSARTFGYMLNMGSYVVHDRGLFSTPSTGIPCSRLYDNRLGTAPPPFFPTTGNKYEVLSWQRVGSTIE